MSLLDRSSPSSITSITFELQKELESALASVRREVRDLGRYHLDRHGVPLKLDQNENPLPLPATLERAIEESLRSLAPNRYPDLLATELRESLSRLAGWPAEGVLIGNGSNDLLLMLALSTLEKNRKAVLPTPSFSTFEHVTRLMGAEPVPIPPREDLSHSAEAFIEAITRARPSLVFLCSPNNPTGYAMPPDDIERVVSHCPGVVAVDEAYFEFAGWSARSLLPRHPRMVVLRTFSKAMGLAGLRVGYLLAHPDLASELAKAQVPYAVNAFSRAVAAAACGHVEILRERAQTIVNERDRLYAALRRMGGVRPHPSSANFILFDCEAGAGAVFEGLLSRGVLVRDLSRHSLLPRALRVTVGGPDENERFLEALGRTLEEMR